MPSPPFLYQDANWAPLSLTTAKKGAGRGFKYNGRLALVTRLNRDRPDLIDQEVGSDNRIVLAFSFDCIIEAKDDKMKFRKDNDKDGKKIKSCQFDVVPKDRWDKMKETRTNPLEHMVSTLTSVARDARMHAMDPSWKVTMDDESMIRKLELHKHIWTMPQKAQKVRISVNECYLVNAGM